MKFLSICKASVAVAAAIASVVLMACEKTPPNTTEETLRQRVKVPSPIGGEAEFETERHRKFKVLPGLIDPGAEGSPPRNYVPYGCYPLGDSGIEICMYVDPDNPGRPWLVRPAGAWVTIGGPVEGVGAYAANIGVYSVTAKVTPGGFIKIESGDLWPFAAVLKQNRRGAWEIQDWIVLDPNWSW